MSSLRRRAICVQRAMSIDRSSIGARASARTTAVRIPRVGQQPQPGEQVTDLGPLEEGRVADHAMRHRALLKRDGDRLPLPRDIRHEHRDPAGLDLLPRDQPLDLRGHRLRLGAIVLAAPERRWSLSPGWPIR